jgi:hypothetical protein
MSFASWFGSRGRGGFVMDALCHVARLVASEPDSALKLKRTHYQHLPLLPGKLREKPFFVQMIACHCVFIPRTRLTSAGVAARPYMIFALRRAFRTARRRMGTAVCEAHWSAMGYGRAVVWILPLPSNKRRRPSVPKPSSMNWETAAAS